MGRQKEPVEPRFWAKVQKAEPDECWEWVAGKGGRGYGMFWLDGKQVKAHRVSWMLENGPIPHGQGYHGTCVCRSCDNPGCVNPSHLFLGSNSDNQIDAWKKNRYEDALKARRDHARILTFRGKSQTITKWATELGLPRGTITSRLFAGWSIDRALAEPSQKREFSYAGLPLMFRGRSQTLSDWSIELGINQSVLANRLRNGWSGDRTLAEPPMRSKRFLTFNEERLSIAEWARRTDIPYATIYSRLGNLGWTVERTLTTPVRGKHEQSIE